jgi:hypothetical protein
VPRLARHVHRLLLLLRHVPPLLFLILLWVREEREGGLRGESWDAGGGRESGAGERRQRGGGC